MQWSEYRDRVLAAWRQLLAADPEELAVHTFLERHPAMIPGGSGDVGPGGHHGSTHSAVFSKPILKGLGRDFAPDFMWVTRSTSLITPILIEIEKPSKRWFRKDGRPTAEFSQAHDQLNDWRSWFAKGTNAANFRETYSLDGERFADRPLEPWFVLIFGRASEFKPGGGHADPAALRHKRDLQRREHEMFMTFDSLTPRHDHGVSMSISMTATGAEAIAFSPVYGTDTESGQVAHDVRSISDALARSEMMSAERRAYLAERFDHWAAVEAAGTDRHATRVRQFGYE